MLRAPVLTLDESRSAAPLLMTDAEAVVRSVVSASDNELDYAKAKVAFDSLVDPTIDQEGVFEQLDELTNRARELMRGDTRSAVRLGAVRRLIYESGPWNDCRPFSYDHDDPYGRKSPNKLLHHYLATRCGQCVSMPILFLIIAERLGLRVALACAPEHVFVRFTDDVGREHNLETTSGAHPSRDAWYREKFPITDRAIQTGIYLRSLTKREGVALMASTVVEHLKRQSRFQEVIEIAKVVLSQCPRDVTMMLWQGTSCGALLEQIRTKYPNPLLMPPAIRAQAYACMEGNRRAFKAAENLGWVEPRWEI